MDKKQKVVNFIKREGFYVILFVCLCVVATVAAVTAKKNVEPKQEVPVVEEQKPSDELSKKDDSSVIKFDDAELVKDKQEEKNATTSTQPKQEAVAKDDKKEEAVATSTAPSKGFINPVNDGVITRTFNFRPVLNEAKTGATVYNGVDIEAAVGSEVKAISDGTVLEATKGDSKEGYYVTVEHADGLIATYANLSEELSVKTGDKITQGTVLGTVGNSVQNNPESRVSTDYLLLEMEKANEPVNPQDYLKEIPTK